MTRSKTCQKFSSKVWNACKQAIRPGVHGGKDGAFRATFEDKPLLSDIVFLRAWIAVDLPRFYNPVTNLLAPPITVSRAPKPGKVISFVAATRTPAAPMYVYLRYLQPDSIMYSKAKKTCIRAALIFCS